MIRSASPKVQLLDPHTINQIAAGEVVERPASVLKELVENSLDAAAACVEVRLEEAGKRLIEVSDDGHGMAEADAVTALERHATSKIRSGEDLTAIGTLGFRGEALPSIASVARMTLSSCTGDGARVQLRAEGGRIERLADSFGPRGTCVRVEELFYNTPARLKFLKTDATELAACVDVLSHYALAHPRVRFKLRHGAQSLLSTSGSGDARSAAAEVWGRDHARALAEVRGHSALGRVTGLISPPEATRATRAFQWAFVNGRPVRSKTLTAAIDAAYRALTPERRYPSVILLMEVDPALVDVNVSPTKSEVKFCPEGAAFELVRGALRAGLIQHGMIPNAAGLAVVRGALAEASPAGGWRVSEPPPHSLSLLAQLPLGLLAVDGAAAHALELGPQGALDAAGDSLAGCALDAARGPNGYSVGDLMDGLRIIGQLMNTFIVAENRRGLVLVDQHVAHERVLFERLRATRGSCTIETQALLAPETLELDRAGAELLTERLPELARLGFGIEPFGPSSFLVRSVPAILGRKNVLSTLRDLSEQVVSGCVGPMADVREALWALCSCKMAIKAGDTLGSAEMHKLLSDLALTENPYLCPHGRPITIFIERADLLRKFKRT